MTVLETAIRRTLDQAIHLTLETSINPRLRDIVAEFLDAHGLDGCEELLEAASALENQRSWLAINHGLIYVLATRGELADAQDFAERLCTLDAEHKVCPSRMYVLGLLTIGINGPDSDMRRDYLSRAIIAAASIDDTCEQILSFRDIYKACESAQANKEIVRLTQEAFDRDDFCTSTFGIIIHCELTHEPQYFDLAMKLFTRIADPVARKDVESYFSEVIRNLPQKVITQLSRETALPELRDLIGRITRTEQVRHTRH